jgi:hypothetical protein
MGFPTVPYEEQGASEVGVDQSRQTQVFGSLVVTQAHTVHYRLRLLVLRCSDTRCLFFFLSYAPHTLECRISKPNARRVLISASRQQAIKAFVLF